MNFLVDMPQSLDVGASPTFAGLTLTGNLTVPGGGTIGGAAGSIVLTPSGSGVNRSPRPFDVIAATDATTTGVRFGSFKAITSTGYEVYTVGANTLLISSNQTGGLLFFTNGRFGFGTTTDSGGLCNIGTNTTAASGGSIYGTDMAWYRAGGGQMTLDGVGLADVILSIRENGITKGWLRSSLGVMTLQSNTASNLILGTNGSAAITCDGTTQDATFANKIHPVGGLKRVTTQFDKTSSAALANVTGLSVALKASTTYRFRAVLFTTSDVAGGVQAAIAHSGTVTNIIYEGFAANAGAIAQARATASGTAVAAVTAVTAATITIEGTIVTNAAGNLTVQFAQNASNAAASSVLVGSYLEVFGF